MTDAGSGSSHGNPTVRHEETLAISDDEGAGRLAGWVRVVVAFLVVSSVVAVGLVVVAATQGVVSRVGGMVALGAVVDRLVADQPVLVAAVVLAALLCCLVGVASLWMFTRNLGRAFDREVRVRVTDAGVSVERSGSRYWQSPGVEVAFDDITAVEYVHPEESSFRVELRDLRAPKFFAGRSRDWVRLERTNGPAIYVGSDRPRELAETIAREVPGDVTARPF